MSTMSLRLPESLHEKLREVAERDGISMNQFITTALAEKLSALLTEEYIEARGARGSREQLEAILDRTPDVAPDEGDEL